MPIEVVYDDETTGATTPPAGGIEVVYDEAPTVPPAEMGLLEKISAAFAYPGEKFRGAIGASTPEEVEASTRNYLSPMLGELAGSGLAKAHGLVYGAATDPVSLVPFGAIAKKGAAGAQMVKQLNRAFTGLQALGAGQSANQLAKQIKQASDSGNITPELVSAAVDTAFQAAGVGLGVAGERNLRAAGATPDAPVAPPHEIPPADLALLEQLNAARAEGLPRQALTSDPTQPPPTGKPVKMKGRPYTAIDDAVAQLQRAEIDSAPVEPSEIQEPSGYRDVEGQGILPEEIARQADIEAFLRQVEESSAGIEPPVEPSALREPALALEDSSIGPRQVMEPYPADLAAIEAAVRDALPPEAAPAPAGYHRMPDGSLMPDAAMVPEAATTVPPEAPVRPVEERPISKPDPESHAKLAPAYEPTAAERDLMQLEVLAGKDRASEIVASERRTAERRAEERGGRREGDVAPEPTPEAQPELPPDATLEQRQQAILDQLYESGTDMRAGARQGPKQPKAPETVRDVVLGDTEKLGPESGALLIGGADTARTNPVITRMGETVGWWLQEAGGLSKALPSSADVSAPLRQGAKLGVLAPKEFARATKDMLGYFKDAKAYKGLVDSLDARSEAMKGELGASYKDVGLDITAGLDDRPLDVREESFRTKVAQKIPWVRASDRAYNGFLSQLRADVFDMWAQSAMRDGHTFESNPQLFKSYAEVVNTLSGRGDLGALKGAATTLNSIFFSPKFMAAKVRQFSRMFGVGPNRMPMQAKAKLLESHLKFYGAFVATVGLAKAAGYAVEDNPTHPDFGKIREGELRLDLGAGDLQWIRLFATMAQGAKTKLSGEKVAETRFDIGKTFAANKAAPLARYLYNLSNARTDAAREKATIEAGKTVFPMLAQDAWDVIKSSPNLMTSAAVLGLAGFGASASVYPEPGETTPETEEAFERKFRASQAAADIRERTPTPRAEPKTPQEQAESAEKGLKRATFTERALKAIRSGNIPAAYQVQLEALDADIDLDVDELIEREERDRETDPDSTARPSL